MKKKMMVMGLLVAGLCGLAFVHFSASPSGAAPVDGVTAIPGTSSEAQGARPIGQPSVTTHHEGAAPAQPSAHAAPAPRLTEAEDRVLSMYDDITSALSEAEQGCDAMGLKFQAAVESHAKDLNAWSQSQKDLSPEELEADHNRLLQVVGSRMQAAQDAIRRTMGKCLESEPFQDALRDLTTLGTPG